MKKRKIFKTLAFSSLALVMATAGIFAFAPIGARASTPPPTTTSTGLGLDPKNDPVVYTTESGLEIKFGGFAPTGTLPAGSLNGYPYFTMGQYSGLDVNWIIIGIATDVELLLNNSVEHLFSTWRTNYNVNGLTDVSGYGTYFFENIYESFSPAGELIESTIASKTKIIDKIIYNKPKSNQEIPSGCFLAISECTLGNSVFNATSTNSDSAARGNRYRYASDNSNGTTWSNKTNGYLYSYIYNLYNSNLGLTSAQKSLIQPQLLNYMYAPKTNGSYSYETDSTKHYMFPLQYGGNAFAISQYLTTVDLRIAHVIGTTTVTKYWTASGDQDATRFVRHVDETGNIIITWAKSTGDIKTYGTSASIGVRPAMVMKLQ